MSLLRVLTGSKIWNCQISFVSITKLRKCLTMNVNSLFFSLYLLKIILSTHKSQFVINFLNNIHSECLNMKTVKTVFHFTLNTGLWKCIIHCICFTGEIWSLCITPFKSLHTELIKCESKTIYIVFLYINAVLLNIHSINIVFITSAHLWTTWMLQTTVWDPLM